MRVTALFIHGLPQRVKAGIKMISEEASIYLPLNAADCACPTFHHLRTAVDCFDFKVERARCASHERAQRSLCYQACDDRHGLFPTTLPVTLKLRVRQLRPIPVPPSRYSREAIERRVSADLGISVQTQCRSKNTSREYAAAFHVRVRIFQ